MWKWINRILVIILVGLVIVLWQSPKQRLEIVFCDVGQGDATLVSYGKLQMLVDGGPDSSVLSCLGKNMAFWDRKIELIVVSHPQADHMTGIIEVVRRYKVGKLAMTRVENKTPEMEQLKQVIESLKVTNLELVAGDVLRLGEVKLKVIHPFNKGPTFVKDPNQVSTVMLGSYGSFDFLLTGDIDEAIEEQLRLTDKLRDVEVLKVAHHGSKYSSSTKFLEEIKPELAVIQVGENRFGHPTGDGVGAKVLRTDEGGAVKVISTGQNWQVK